MKEKKENDSMPIERWREACKAGSNAANYRRERGYTITKDDAFVDGVQWADEHPTQDSYKKYLSNKVWHEISEDPTKFDSPFLLINSSKCDLLKCDYLDVFKIVAKKFDKWAYIEDLLPDNV